MNENVETVNYKQCTKCKDRKTLDDFGKKSNSKDGKDSWCKDCVRSVQRAIYHNNPQPYKDRAHAFRDRLREYLLAFLTWFRGEKGCAACGESCVACLDFHHHVAKGTPVTRAMSKGYKKLETELAKCVIICANCHRKAHAGLFEVKDDWLCAVKIPRLVEVETVLDGSAWGQRRNQ